jgi:diamine N-acetyltransferase
MLSKDEIKLRPISIKDTDFVIQLRNDLEIANNFFSDPPVYDFAHNDWLRRHSDNIDFIIEYSGKNAGRINIVNINYKNQKAEYGIMIDKEFQRKNIGLNASKLLIDYVFENLTIRKITLNLFEENTGAMKLYESLGFQVEGKFIEDVYKNGKWKNVIQMALFKKSWKKNSK